MAHLTDKTKAKILVDLELGETPKVIAERYSVGRATIYNMREAQRKDTEERNKIELARKATTLGIVVEKLKSTAPPTVKADLVEILDAAESLQKLEVNFHKSFNEVLATANVLLSSPNVTIIDWQIITATLAAAFKDIYNSTGTTINVAQGGQGENKLSMFQSRMKN